VLVEALAVGTPVCRPTPRTVLARSSRAAPQGRLVPVGDPAALAEALAATLDDPPRPIARHVLAPFDAVTGANRYLDVIETAVAGRPRRQEPADR
jgi:glycosyltransferase involved in cell wall biosynthesis